MQPDSTDVRSGRLAVCDLAPSAPSTAKWRFRPSEKPPFSAIFHDFFDDFHRVFLRACPSGRQLARMRPRKLLVRSKTVYGMKRARVLRVETRRRPVAAEVTDRSPWDWYAQSCPCGLPPGECRAHPRGRPSQRPPAGDWRVWGYVAGRGAGKTRSGACWVQHRVEAGAMKVGCLIAPTAADIRDVMVEGQSGLLAIAPPWCRPRFEPSKRRVQWPNGARAVCLSGEEPERARGLTEKTRLGRQEIYDLDRRAPRRHPRRLS
jgi:hypothetical protein